MLYRLESLGVIMSAMKLFALFAAFCVPVAAQADETLTYTYDARGRVIKVEHSGTANNGVTTQYTVDKAENRTNVNTAGAT